MKKLELGFMMNDLLAFSQKCRCDFIEDDEYIKGVIGNNVYE